MMLDFSVVANTASLPKSTKGPKLEAAAGQPFGNNSLSRLLMLNFGINSRRKAFTFSILPRKNISKLSSLSYEDIGFIHSERLSSSAIEDICS